MHGFSASDERELKHRLRQASGEGGRGEGIRRYYRSGIGAKITVTWTRIVLDDPPLNQGLFENVAKEGWTLCGACGDKFVEFEEGFFTSERMFHEEVFRQVAAAPMNKPMRRASSHFVFQRDNMRLAPGKRAHSATLRKTTCQRASSIMDCGHGDHDHAPRCQGRKEPDT